MTKYMPESSEQDRLANLDLIKAVAIFLVCYYHSQAMVLGEHAFPLAGRSESLTYLFHALPVVSVPLFFMVNGALMLNKPLDMSRHLARTARLFALMAVWALLSTVLVMAMKQEPVSAGKVLASMYWLKVGYCNHLWFLRALIMIYLLHPVIKPAFDNASDPRALYLILGVAFVFSFGQCAFDNVMDVVRAVTGRNIYGGDRIGLDFGVNPFGGYFYSLVYYIAGGLMVRHGTGWCRGVSRRLMIMSFVLSWALLFGYGLMKSRLVSAVFDTVFPCFFTVMALAMSVACFAWLSTTGITGRRAGRIIKAVGSGTLGIYLVHHILNVAVAVYLPSMAGLFSRGAVIGLGLYSAALVVASLLVSASMKRIPYAGRLFTL